MSFFDCVDAAMGDEDVRASREMGEKAQKLWKEKSDEYERQGHDRQDAEYMAGEDVKAAFKKKAGEDRHVFLARIKNMRKLQRNVTAADNLAKMQTRSIEALDYKARGLTRYFNGRLGDLLKEHHRNLLGRVTKPAQMMNVVREMYGQGTGDIEAGNLARAIEEVFEEMRTMANEAGALIGKLDNYGVPQSHNRRAVTQAGFDTWASDVGPRIDWTRIEDRLTGKPFQKAGGPPPSAATQTAFLKEIYDNIAFGKDSRDAVYGKAQGSAMYRRHSESRVMHFKSADDWVGYNKRFGSGDPFSSIMSHVHRMSRDIVAMQEFGPNPGLGVDYQSQLVNKTAREQGLKRSIMDDYEGNGKHAVRMMRVQQGGAQAETMMQDAVSTFFSTARHVMTSAFLDRAILASISDTNTMRLAASAVGMNPANVMRTHIDLMANGMKRDEALRAGWIADTLADPGAALARFQSEVPPAEVAERLSSASMRVQGLSGWTDQARIAFQFEMAGHIASFAGRNLKDVDDPLRGMMVKAGITQDDWARFTDPAMLYKAANGATFASPHYWRSGTDLSNDQANDIFMKFQGLIEEQTEYAVPTQSLLARGMADPAAFDMPPGSIGYEIMKSGLSFKSFVMTYTVNQIRRIAAQPTIQSRIGYGLNLAAGATVMGAVALQLGELFKGNDPMNMNPMDHPTFWTKAAAKGGGFAIMGDIVATGQSTWGGGFSSYVAGPVPQAVGDVYDLTFKNAYEFATGQDTKIAKEITRFGKRYTPMGQTPLIGPAMDRLFWDELHKFLDPETAAQQRKSAQRTNNLNSTDGWWMPGSPTPDRAPNLANAFGG